MEETLGKRIARCRKGLGLTQDRLADLLGVTAQAVSKWENDQSCPDIGTIPKLADIFGISTDALLGKENVDTPKKENRQNRENQEEGCVEVSVHTGKRSMLGLGIWLLLAGGMNILGKHLEISLTLWTSLWTTGLIVFGIFGLYPRFSLFRLCCGLLGGFYLAGAFTTLPELSLSTLLLIVGGILLLEGAFGRRRKTIQIHTPRIHSKAEKSACTSSGETFHADNSFSSRNYSVDLEKLTSGKAEVSFGDQTVDLSGCKSFGAGAAVWVDCSFGHLILLVPGRCRVISDVSSSFGECNVYGQPDPDASETLYVNGDVSFGECEIRYV